MTVKRILTDLEESGLRSDLGHCMAQNADLIAEIERLTTEDARLRKLLDEYGRHHSTCYQMEVGRDENCDCGWNAEKETIWPADSIQCQHEWIIGTTEAELHRVGTCALCGVERAAIESGQLQGKDK